MKSMPASLFKARCSSAGCRLVLSKDRPHWPFVTGDEQLAGVAELEGFDVIIPEAAR